MTETSTITCVVEFDGERNEYSIEFTDEKSRALAERTLRRMVARKLDPTLDSEQAILAEMMSFMKDDGGLVEGVCRSVNGKTAA